MADAVKATISDKDLQGIIDDIKLEQVIPVIGYELLTNEFDAQNADSDFLKQLMKLVTNDDHIADKFPNARTGYELINAYYHMALGNDEKKRFKMKISEVIRKNRLNWSMIPENYRKLVSINKFKLYINATVTNVLEMAFNACRGEGTTEEEIKASYSILNYQKQNSQDLTEPALEKDFYINLEKPVIFNLFGTHDAARADYVFTDSDYVELIYDLIEDKTKRIKNLTTYLNASNLLFLGCNFPDWFFRFFMRICVGKRLDDVTPINKKAVIDSLNQFDSSRTIFINQYGIKSFNVDCHDLINRIYDAFKQLEIDEETTYLSKCTENNLVFISYCNADRETADAVAKQFDDYNIDYFRDTQNLRSGDNLHDKIKAALDKSCLILTIVSGNVQKSSPYVWREWNYVTGKQMKIMPLFKEFVDVKMLAPVDFAILPEVRMKILDKDETLGYRPTANGVLEDKDLGDIKRIQYFARVSGEKIK